MTLDDLLSKLRGVRRSSGGDATAICPAHDDKSPSLSIGIGNKGIVLKCHSGCRVPDICSALGIKERDLFFDKPHRNGSSESDHDLPIVAQYIYTDEFGTPVLRVTRHVAGNGKKTFRQWRPGPSGDWLSGTKDPVTKKVLVRPVLYRLPEILEAIAVEHTIFVVEGEKDVETMTKAGLDATTSPAGAGKWRPEYTDFLRGARVVVIADKDKPGRAHAIEVATSLLAVASSVKYIELPGSSVKDATDFLSQGGTVDQINRKVSETLDFDPENPPEEDGDEFPEIDTANLVCPNPPPVPALIIDDLLHQKLKMIVGGPSKAHKSWTFLDLGLSVASGSDWLGFKTHPCKVLYLNFEIPREFAIWRIKKVCDARGIEYPDNFDMLSLRGKDTRASVIIPKLIRRCERAKYGLVIVDPAYKLQGDDYDENSASSVHSLLREIERLSVGLNAAIITGAHFAKGSAAAKEVLDRISGSGVFARDPDVFVVLTPHEADDAFAFEVKLRNLPPIPNFCVRWKYPLMVRDDKLDPSQLKRPAKKDGSVGRKRPNPDVLLKILPKLGTFSVTKPRSGVFSGAQLRAAFADAGYHVSMIPDVVTLAIESGLIECAQSSLPSRQKFYGVPTAVQIWRPYLADQDEAERASRKRPTASRSKATSETASGTEDPSPAREVNATSDDSDFLAFTGNEENESFSKGKK